MKSDLITAAIIELEKALTENKQLLETNGKRTLHVKLTTTKITAGHRIAGSCTAGGKKYFSFGTIVTTKPEEL